MRALRGRLWLSTARISLFQKALLVLMSVCACSLVLIAYQLSQKPPTPRRNLPTVTFCCEQQNYSYTVPPTDALKRGLPRTDRRVLLLVETRYSQVGKDAADLLNALKVPFRQEVLGKNLPPLTTTARGRFSLVIVENYYKYLNMDDWNRQLLDKYCIEYEVGLMGFLLSRPDLDYAKAKVRGFPLEILQKQQIHDLRFNASNNVPFIAKPGQVLSGEQKGHDWLLFRPLHQSFSAVLMANTVLEDGDVSEEDLGVVLQDQGEFDGVRRVLFGYNLRFWLVKLAFVDALKYLSDGELGLPLSRYVQIDIDDIFVGPTGYRMVKEDVEALMVAQERFRSQIPGFTFNLGFSGKYYRAGNYEENKGDEALIENAHVFNWFGHMWKHQQAHKHSNASDLASLMTTNKAFATTHNIPIRWPYAVAPHHSGVYPVHEQLYEAWKKVWGIRVTSTEEYPHLKPVSLRRGFIHRGIMVLPRQTCGLYTHTVYKDAYPGGSARLDESIFGGELFFTFVLNPFLIFMTHSTNFGSDRLALYTFESSFRFLNCWTNLQLRAINPVKLAKLYFERYTEERDPLWGNPCQDGRHMDIWAADKNCLFLPKAVIVGPQKTGSTALHSFLSLHPGVQSSKTSNKTFEEVQFFGGKNYANGIDWYMSFFDFEYNETEALPYLFEKSATYFDSEIAPKQVHALLPDAKIIAILISPAKRAYSWYQHVRAKGDPTAQMYSFEEVIAADETSGRDLYKLRQHCISPGKYVHFLEKWIEQFPSKQLLIVDGEDLKSQPASVMSVVQQFLGLEVIDYSEILQFDDKKGFFCQAHPGRPKCLGKGKGRRYPPMSDQIRKELQQYYRTHNVALHRMLAKLGYRTPVWLQEELLGI